jgi:oxygen-independent coproporphyrinogen-3 oxidase
MIIASGSYKDEIFDSIFIGGGTPSILSGDKISELLKTLKDNYNFSNSSEITIEGNPEDFINNKNLYKQLKNSGINRISFGIQSFNNDELKFLTREHTSEQAIEVIENAKKYFSNISIDLIYSLPGQKLKNLENTLDTAISLNIPHISAYTLIYEKETPVYNQLKRNIIAQTDDKKESELYLLFSEKLISQGYRHYEVSNYAKEGNESKHNLKYWEYANYIGFGPSAHSMWNGRRWNNFRNIIKYNISLQKGELPKENVYDLTYEEMKTEFIMLRLRSTGVNYEGYEDIFRNNFRSEFKNQISELRERNLSVEDETHFRLNENGFLLVDEICAKYF